MTHYKQMELNLMSSQEDSPAKTSQLQEGKKESSENDHLFGRSMRGSSKMYSRHGRLLKMYRPFDLKDLHWSYKISARSGIMQNGIVYPVPQLVGYTEEIAYGSSPTREMWATPNTMDHLPPKSKEAMKKQFLGVRKGRAKPSNLREQIFEELYPNQLFPTELYPTPCARDWKGANKMQTIVDKAKKGMRSHLGQLPNRVALEESLNILSQENRSKDLHNMPKPNGQLNPTWVEWLMGYPKGWTDLKD